jgi:hypothetical protein
MIPHSLYARRRDEPLPLWVLRRSDQRVHRLARAGDALPESNQRTAARPHRYSFPPLRSGIFDVEVPRDDYEKLSSDRIGEPSAKIRERVEAARDRQSAGFSGMPLHCNDDMGPGEVRKFLCGQKSARAYHRILKLARAIADQAGSERIETAHIAEAIQYRPRKQM